jgi:hypothetical protein
VSPAEMGASARTSRHGVAPSQAAHQREVSSPGCDAHPPFGGRGPSRPVLAEPHHKTSDSTVASTSSTIWWRQPNAASCLDCCALATQPLISRRRRLTGTNRHDHRQALLRSSG